MAGRSSEERMAGRSSEERMAGWRSEEERMAGWRSEERMAGQRLLPKAITLTDTAYLHDLHVCCQISTPNIVFKYLRKLCVYVSLRAEVELSTITNRVALQTRLPMNTPASVWLACAAVFLS